MSLTEVQFTGATVEEAPARAIQGRSPWQLAWRRLRADRVAVASAIVIVVLCIIALAAPLIASIVGHQPAITCTSCTSAQGLPAGPSGRFLLGTDNLGRDVLIRMVYGARVSLLVGLSSTAIATVAGVVVGLLAGYYGGVIDGVLARFMDVVLAFPYLILALALVTVFGPSLPMVIAVIAFFSWAALARIVRGQTMSIKEKEYVEAARAIGTSPIRIMLVDILPNVIAPVLVVATLLVPTAIVFESTLSYLGLGIQPPTASWGNMISDSQNYYQVAWWFLIFPAGALLITTLAFNLLGDGVRDAIDPSTERIFAARRRRKRELPVEGPSLVEPPRPVITEE
ncbi:MAG: ABC transporter permease [Micromonosporaceae bacterium]